MRQTPVRPLASGTGLPACVPRGHILAQRRGRSQEGPPPPLGAHFTVWLPPALLSAAGAEVLTTDAANRTLSAAVGDGRVTPTPQSP